MNILKATLRQYEHRFVFTNPDQGGSKSIRASTRHSCSHLRLSGEVLYMILEPSSPQISYLVTTSPTSRPLRSPEPVACAWWDTVREAKTSYSLVLSTSVLSYSRHFTPSKTSCLGIYFVDLELVWLQLCYVGWSLKILCEGSELLFVQAWDRC